LKPKNKIPKDLIPDKRKNYICPVCKKKNTKKNLSFSSIFKDTSFPNYEHISCSRCHSLFISNLLSSKKLEYLHNKYYAKWENFNFSYYKSLNRNENDRMLEWYNLYKDKIPNNSPKNKKKSLDIGCGYGGCAAAFKKLNFCSYGIDVQKKCITNSKIKFKGVNFIHGNIDTLIEKKISKFDIITMHDVLEHISEPSTLIKKCNFLLKNNGRIFIKVPNSQSLQLDLLKEYSWEISSPFHRTLFSIDGLKSIANKNNLIISEIFEDLNTWGWTRGLSIKSNLEKYYEKLRQNIHFKKLDYNIDLLLENISKKINQKSIHFIVMKRKK